MNDKEWEEAFKKALLETNGAEEVSCRLHSLIDFVDAHAMWEEKCFEGWERLKRTLLLKSPDWKPNVALPKKG